MATETPRVLVTTSEPAAWSPDEARRVLSELTSIELSGELHSAARTALELEERRFALLAQKASWLSSAAAVSVSISVGLGKTLTDNAAIVRHVGTAGVLTFGVGIAFGLGAVVLATLVLLVRNFQEIDESQAFREDILKMAADAGGTQGVMVHRGFMAVHYLRVARNNARVNHRAARVLRWGQICLIAFLLFVAVSLVPITVSQYGALTVSPPTPNNTSR